MNSLKNKALSGFSWSLFDKLINQVGSFLLLIYLSRVLSPSDFGLIAMLAIFLMVTESLINSGLSQALVQRSHNVTQIDLSTVFFTNFVMSVLLYACLYFTSPLIAEFYDQPELIKLSRALFIIVIINSFIIVPKSILIIEVDFRTQSIANTIATTISSIVAIYMVVNNYGYWSLVGMNIARATSIAVSLFLFTKWMPSLTFCINSFQRLFSFGSKLLVAGLLATIVQNLYTLLIGRYFSVSKVGYYQQSHSYTNMLSDTISSVVQGVTYPLMTSIQEDTTRLVEMYIKVMGVVTLVTFPIFIGFMAVSEEFVILFLGEKWRPIIPILMILACARVITPISSLNLNILNAKGRSDLFLKTDLCKLPIAMISLIIALPYGLEAIAMSQVVTVLISFFINAHYPGKLFGFGWLEQVKLIAPTFLSSVVMYFVLNLIHFEDMLLQFSIKILAGIFVYIFFCWVLKVPSFIYIVKMYNSRTSF